MPKLLMLDQARFRKVPAYRKVPDAHKVPSVSTGCQLLMRRRRWRRTQSLLLRRICSLGRARERCQVTCLFVRECLVRLPSARDPSWIGASNFVLDSSFMTGCKWSRAVAAAALATQLVRELWKLGFGGMLLCCKKASNCIIGSLVAILCSELASVRLSEPIKYIALPTCPCQCKLRL